MRIHKEYTPFIIVLIGLVAVLLSSCGCNYHLEKARRKCGKTTFTDTIFARDTIFINSSSKDTVFRYNQTDTVIVKEGRLTMKYFYDTRDNTVFLSGKCDTVWVPVEIKVPYEKTVLNFNYWAWIKSHCWWILFWVIILGAGTMLLRMYFPALFKRK